MNSKLIHKRVPDQRDVDLIKKYHNPKFWGTADELDFLKRIGSHRVQSHDDKLVLLVKYSRIMEERKRWGGVDVDKVQDFVDEEIKKVSLRVIRNSKDALKLVAS